MRRKERTNTPNWHSHPSSSWRLPAFSIWSSPVPLQSSKDLAPGLQPHDCGDKNVSVILTGPVPKEEKEVWQQGQLSHSPSQAFQAAPISVDGLILSMKILLCICIPLKSPWCICPFHLHFCPCSPATPSPEICIFMDESGYFGKSGWWKDDSREELGTLQICPTSELLLWPKATAPLTCGKATEAPVRLLKGP